MAQFVGITSKDYDPAPAEAFVRSSRSPIPASTTRPGRCCWPFAGRTAAQRHPVDHDHRQQGRLAVRVLGEVSKITLVDMINDVADGQ